MNVSEVEESKRRRQLQILSCARWAEGPSSPELCHLQTEAPAESKNADSQDRGPFVTG